MATIEALPPRISDEGDPGGRERMAREHMAFARSLALRYRHGAEPVDDLIQVACVGLVKAINRFDPGRGTSFESFAAPTILGELKRHFRDRVMPIHLPRGLQEHLLELNDTTDALTAELDREPSVSELADRAQMSEEEVADAMGAARALRTLSLDAPVAAADSAPVVEAVGDTDSRLERAEVRAALWRAFRVLDRREHAVVQLRFVSDLTQEQIGERIGVSQVHVSRILSAALGKLRMAVGDGARIEEAA
jgi:RNA polymerase sigma-B factor